MWSFRSILRAPPLLRLTQTRGSAWSRLPQTAAAAAAGQQARPLSAQAGQKKPVFCDMVHSNNAARIRLWIKLKGLEDRFECKMVTYADLQSEEFKKLNPLKKVPGFLTEDGDTVFESDVIMQYLEDVFGHHGMSLVADTPYDRAMAKLLVRCHDLYIASPNCTQPNFAHTQGAMYLAPYETPFCGKERTMDKATRAAKLAEIWKQLTWLESQVRGPYLVGEKLTHADCTWFPTAIFMEFMLPRVFSWPAVFREDQHFPKLRAWYEKLLDNDIFRTVHSDIWGFWIQKERDGQFESIKFEIKDPGFKWQYP